jgi:hypothetical protein
MGPLSSLLSVGLSLWSPGSPWASEKRAKASPQRHLLPSLSVQPGLSAHSLSSVGAVPVPTSSESGSKSSPTHHSHCSLICPLLGAARWLWKEAGHTPRMGAGTCGGLGACSSLPPPQDSHPPIPAWALCGQRLLCSPHVSASFLCPHNSFPLQFFQLLSFFHISVSSHCFSLLKTLAESLRVSEGTNQLRLGHRPLGWPSLFVKSSYQPALKSTGFFIIGRPKGGGGWLRM